VLIATVSALSTPESYSDADAVVRSIHAASDRGPSMLAELQELWRYRHLLVSMVRRELRIRYKDSLLGFFWSFVNPLVTVIVMTFVFKTIMKNDTPNYSAYVLAGYLPFTFFQMGLMDSAQSVVGSLPLIRKIYLPREILPLSFVIANFIHLILAMGMFFLYLGYIYLTDPRESPFRMTAMYLPFLLIVNLFLVTGFSLLISALNVFYEDVKYVVGIITYLLFFMCPVMYFGERVYYSLGVKGYVLYFLNPVAMLVHAYRKVLLAPQPQILHQGRDQFGHQMPDIINAPVPLSWKLLLFSTLFSLFILWYGYRVFNKMKWRFVERV
jgi:lipopolysaccharide transport system permease protein